MICPICCKNRADERIRKTAGGRVYEISVCSDCLPTSVDLSDEGFFYYFKTRIGKTCPYCGRTFDDFLHTSLLGCAHCYDVFAEELSPYINSVQKTK